MTHLPAKGTPESAVWAAAIDIAVDAPKRQGQYVHSAQIRWSLVHRLRNALEASGVDWRAMKERERQ